MRIRGSAFVGAKAKICRIIKKQSAPFIASIGVSGDIKLLARNPMPVRKLCTPEHWDSYERVCRAEGIEIHEEAYLVPGSAYLTAKNRAKSS
jgi:aspartate/tyrosine/aromatic aminotransferase